MLLSIIAYGCLIILPPLCVTVYWQGKRLKMMTDLFTEFSQLSVRLTHDHALQLKSHEIQNDDFAKSMKYLLEWAQNVNTTVAAMDKYLKELKKALGVGEPRSSVEPVTGGGKKNLN